jgi:hypothetical protein
VPNDAKLGMVVGVCLVIVVAVLFVRKDLSTASSPEGPRAVTPAPRMSGARGPASGSPVRPATRTTPAEHSVRKPVAEAPAPHPGKDGDAPGLAHVPARPPR